MSTCISVMSLLLPLRRRAERTAALLFVAVVIMPACSTEQPAAVYSPPAAHNDGSYPSSAPSGAMGTDLAAMLSNPASALAARYRWPRDPVFDDPWVRSNVALTYGHQVQDGIGSQTLRMVAVYSLARSLGVRHLFRPLGCVGHIGEHVHYRDTGCNFTDEAERRQLTKSQNMIRLPASATEEQVAGWTRHDLASLDWLPFVKAVREAAAARRPTLFVVERLNTLVRHYPDVFMALPALRPSSPPAPLYCRQRGAPPSADARARPGRTWLLDALRIALHIRRGDVITDNWHKRVLHTAYYINIAQELTRLLEPLGCEVAIEVYIEAPRTPEGVAEIKLLQEAVPHAVMLIDTEMLWTWQQMATADVIVMSNSMFSMSAALMNPQAVCIHVPYRHYSTRVGMFRLAHWYTPLDENGTLPNAVADDLQRRIALGSVGSGTAAHLAHTQA